MNGPDDLDLMPELGGNERRALEAALARNLRPVDAPQGFMEAVLRRAGLQSEAAMPRSEITSPATAKPFPVRHKPLLSFRSAVEESAVPRGNRDQGERRTRSKLLHWPTAHLQAWGAGALAAAALALAVFAGQQTHLRREQEHELAQKRALATQQFEASVRIMDQTVGSIRERTQERTREQLRRAGVSGIE